MALPYYSLQNPPAAAQIPDGGTLVVGKNVVIPGSAGAMTADGVGFGPVHIGVPDDTIIKIENLSFQSGEEPNGWLAFPAGAVGSAAVAERDNSATAGANGDCDSSHGTDSPPPDGVESTAQLTRRAALGAAVGLATAALGIGTGAAQEEDGNIVLRVAEFDVTRADGPIHISVLDLVDEALPPETDMLVDVSGTRVGGVTKVPDGVTVADEAADGETVRVYLRGSIAIWEQVWAWLKAQLPGSTDVTYAREFPDGQLATAFDTGEFVTLSDHPTIVDPIRAADPAEVRVRVGNTTIPHESEGSTSVGLWSVFHEQVIYEVGENPPNATTYQFTIGLGWLDRLLA